MKRLDVIPMKSVIKADFEFLTPWDLGRRAAGNRSY